MPLGRHHRRRPRRIEIGDEYQSDEIVNRVKVDADPEPDFMGEPWGVSDHVPRNRRVVWDDERQTYVRVSDGNL